MGHITLTAQQRRGKSLMPKIVVMDNEGDRWDGSHEDEHLYWPRVMWIDPGVVSGVAVIWFDPDQLFNDAPIRQSILAYSEWFLSGPEDGRNGQVTRFLRTRKHLDSDTGLATGCESFVPRQLNMSQEFLAPVRIREKIQYTMSMTTPLGQEHLNDGIHLFAQSPSDALGSFNNGRLQTLGMYTPGPDHINDAKRHCLLWLRKLVPAGFEFFEKAHGSDDSWWAE